MIIEGLSDIVRTVIIMSLSGGILALLLFALKPMVRHRLSKQLQYYLWLIVLAALLIPMSKLIVMPETSSNIALAPIHAIVEQNVVTIEEASRHTDMNMYTNTQTEITTTPEAVLVQNPIPTATTVFMMAYPWVGLVILLYNILSYALFTKKVRYHRTRAGKDELYEYIGICGDVNPPRLYRSKFATTPMLIGIFKPEVILPDREYTDAELQSILHHELTHLRRRDVVVKWLSVLACALHWFNPIVWLMRREIDRVCELSCDEAVIRNLDLGGKQNYGNTLISIATDIKASRAVLSTTMCEEKETLKERLNSIMKYQKLTSITQVFSTIILIIAIFTVFVLGAGASTSSVDAMAENPMQNISASISSPKPDKVDGLENKSITVANNPVDADAEYLKHLCENAIEVSTEKEFMDALKSAYVLVLKNNITLSEEFVTLRDIKALVIDEGVTLTIKSPNFHPECEIVNLGEILIDDLGRIIFCREPNYSRIGKVSIRGRTAEVIFATGKIGADEIAYFLAEDSLFTTLNIVAGTSGTGLVEILVDCDIVIPVGKTFWLNNESVLHVREGVTLTNNGTIKGKNKPIIDGTIDGIGKQLF